MFWFDIVLQSTKSAGVRGIEAVSTSSEFTHGAIVHLIEAMQRCWDVYSARERSLLFQSVQKELESHGHSLPVEKIRRKWNNLIVTYKRVKDRSLLCGGQTKTSWEYFEVRDWEHIIILLMMHIHFINLPACFFFFYHMTWLLQAFTIFSFQEIILLQESQIPFLF